MENMAMSTGKQSVVLVNAIISERIRQAQQSFNIALLSLVACSLTGLTGVGLALTGKTIGGALMAAGGMTPILACIQFAKDANNRLDKTFQEIQEDGQTNND
jgi:O-antigen ligase